MRTVASYSTPTEAHLARSRLSSAGISSAIRDEFTVTFDWLISQAIGGVKIDVADEDFTTARQILNLPPPQTGILTCPRCGSTQTHVRPLTLSGALCLVLKLPIPMSRADVDCLTCESSFSTPLNGRPAASPPPSNP